MYYKTVLCLFIVICAVQSQKRFRLKQVVILSRHGLRTPLSKVLNDMTPQPWPIWQEKPGYLTPKGSILEGYMGKFFSGWLFQEDLLPQACPTEDSFYVYANTKQRTLASASSFVNNAFPNCNITIHHSETDTDQIFNPVIHNTSSIFNAMVIEDMRACLKLLSINSTYKFIDKILDYKNSALCVEQHKCDLTTDKNKVFCKPGQKTNVFGPLKIGNSVIDAFIMQYYEGFPIENVAWGNIETAKDWRLLMSLTRGYHNVIFNTSLIAKDIAQPLVKHMSKFFLNDSSPNVVLLMGHDANLYTVMNSLNIKPYMLKHQYELIPISGKVVFQRWYDEVEKEDLLRIDFVYQSPRQLREAVPLNVDNPPYFELLELRDCRIDENGFCLWNDFEKILEDFNNMRD